MSGYLTGVLVTLAFNVIAAYAVYLPLAAGQLNLGIAVAEDVPLCLSDERLLRQVMLNRNGVKLADRGRLPGAVHPDDQDDTRWVGHHHRLVDRLEDLGDLLLHQFAKALPLCTAPADAVEDALEEQHPERGREPEQQPGDDRSKNGRQAEQQHGEIAARRGREQREHAARKTTVIPGCRRPVNPSQQNHQEGGQTQ